MGSSIESINNISVSEKSLSLDCIYDLEPLSFERTSVVDMPDTKGFESQEPLEEINFGTKEDAKPTYI
ncbi:hypothetical protein PIB30_094254, partial [Stylosanthes scabra]|nr:hypothetical protein [Stylosanthes scabra]